MSNKTSSIRRLFLVSMISLALVCPVLWGGIWIHGEYDAFKMESEALRFRHLQAQKDLLRNQVGNAVDYVQYMVSQTEKRLKASIRERVDQGWSTAGHIYLQNREAKTSGEIQKMIKDALRPIRFNQGRGYFFAFNLDGVEELFADRPEMEGKNMLAVTGAHGEPVVRDMIDLVRSQGEGFYEYTWTKPNEAERYFPKIAFVKLFEPYGWVIGTGEYLDDVRNQVQDEVLDRLVNLRFGIEGYFFGSTLQGGPLFSNGRINKGTENLWDLTDPDGVKIFQAQRRAVEQAGGGFVTYSWRKLQSVTAAPAPKLSYVLGVPQWDWIIGAGVYLDTFEQELMAKRETLRNNLFTKIERSFAVFLVLILLILYLVHTLSRRIQSGIRTFSLFFERAATRSMTIDPEELYFKEFQVLAGFANKMLSDRNQAEQALRDSELFLKETQKIARLGGWKANPHTDYLEWTEGVYDILEAPLHYTPGVSEGTNFLLPEYVPILIDRIVHCLDTGEPFEMECRVVTTTGRQLWCEIRGLASVLEGERSFVAGTFQDITARKLAEQENAGLQAQLRQAQKMEAIGTLAGGIAHDFNNILAGIMGYTEMALFALSSHDPLRDNLEAVLKASYRARDLVKQILLFSRMRSGSEHESVDVSQIIEEALQFLRASLPATIEIRQRMESRTNRTLADPTQIHEVLINLCTNAAHAMEEKGGVLEVSLSDVRFHPHDPPVYPEVRPGPYLCLTVADTGHGMDAETLEHIFEPYFTTKDVGKGSGFGLALVHGIVRRHGGGVTVRSEPGKGTTFHVYLPAVEDTARMAEEEEGPVLRGSERILFVDDEEMLTHVAVRMLEQLGYRVRGCTNSLDALSLFRAAPHEFDLVLTDHTMPQMTGMELAREILLVRPDVPIILCTGFSEMVSDEKAKEAGIRELVMKPMQMQRLAGIIRRVLDEI